MPAHKMWTAKEISILRDIYPVSDQEACEEALPGRTWNAMKARAFTLKINRKKVYPEFAKELPMRRGMPTRTPLDFDELQWLAGCLPWNKYRLRDRGEAVYW